MMETPSYNLGVFYIGVDSAQSDFLDRTLATQLSTRIPEEGPCDAI